MPKLKRAAIIDATIKKKKRKKTYEFEDTYGNRRNIPDLSFVVKGVFAVQERGRIAAVHVGKKPRIYDPSAKEKKDFTAALREELEEYGVKDFPFFTAPQTNPLTSKGLMLEVAFFMNRIKDDFEKVNGVEQLKEICQQYPAKKDADNMLKFLMDALHDVVYDDDKCVVNIIASKSLIDTYDKNKAYSTIRISKIP